MEEDHETGSEAEWHVVSGLGELPVNSGGLCPVTGAHRAARHRSLFSAKEIGPVVLDMAQTAQVVADVLYGEEDEPEREAGVEEGGKSDRWTAVMGMGRALVNVALNTSGGQAEGRCRRGSAAR